MMHIYLIRHGESYHNIRPWDTLDTMDTVLTEKGRKQSEYLRDWLRNSPLQADAIYCSTLRRTVETAAIVAQTLNLDPIPDHRIREINSNYGTGLPIEETRLPRSYNPSFDSFVPRNLEFDGAESWMHFRTRLGAFVNMLLEKHREQHVFMVVHGGVINGILDNCFNVGPVRTIALETYNTAWTHIEYRPDTELPVVWFLRAHNRIDHLIGSDLL